MDALIWHYRVANLKSLLRHTNLSQVGTAHPLELMDRLVGGAFSDRVLQYRGFRPRSPAQGFPTVIET